MPTLSAAPKTLIISNTDIASLPIEALMVAVLGNYSALLDASIRTEAYGMSETNKKIAYLQTTLKLVSEGTYLSDNVTVVNKLNEYNIQLELGTAADQVTLTTNSLTDGDGNSFLQIIEKDASRVQRNAAKIQTKLDSLTATSQEQSTRLQSWKDQLSRAFQLMSVFSKSVADTSETIANHIA